MQKIDRWTIVGIAAALMPLLTMWHEIGGHALACVSQGGRVATLGAFYVDCTGLEGAPRLLVSCAGVLVNILLALLAFALWRRVRKDLARLLCWYVWVSEGFVAAGYFLFSGFTAFGDLGVGKGGGLAQLDLPLPWLVQLAEIAVGGIAYVGLVRAAIRTLRAMIGDGPATRGTRRSIAHLYYATAGGCALLVGLLNPVGIVITIMSAAASSFGGLAGFISVGYATQVEGEARAFTIRRRWRLILLGAAVLAGFVLLLGPSRHF